MQNHENMRRRWPLKRALETMHLRLDMPSQRKKTAMEGMMHNEVIKQLREHQKQLDADGCMVGVSRQALDEVLAYADLFSEMREALEHCVSQLHQFKDDRFCRDAWLNGQKVLAKTAQDKGGAV